MILVALASRSHFPVFEKFNFSVNITVNCTHPSYCDYMKCRKNVRGDYRHLDNVMPSKMSIGLFQIACEANSYKHDKNSSVILGT